MDGQPENLFHWGQCEIKNPHPINTGPHRLTTRFTGREVDAILSRTFTNAVIQPEPKKDEIGALVTMLKWNSFDQKTLIIADRGFESYTRRFPVSYFVQVHQRKT